jgi:hypothetical protein
MIAMVRLGFQIETNGQQFSTDMTLTIFIFRWLGFLYLDVSCFNLILKLYLNSM